MQNKIFHYYRKNGAAHICVCCPHAVKTVSACLIIMLIMSVSSIFLTFSQENITWLQTGRNRHICIDWFDLVSLLLLITLINIRRNWSLELQPWHQFLIWTCQSCVANHWRCVFSFVLVAKLSCHFQVLLMKQMWQILMNSTESSTGQRQEMASRSYWCRIVDETLTQIYRKCSFLQRLETNDDIRFVFQAVLFSSEVVRRRQS